MTAPDLPAQIAAVERATNSFLWIREHLPTVTLHVTERDIAALTAAAATLRAVPVLVEAADAVVRRGRFTQDGMNGLRAAVAPFANLPDPPIGET